MENQQISDLATRLKNLISKTEGDFTILFDRPDPDSMGSALGINLILKSLGKKSKIFYSGRVSHHQNKSIFSKYNLASRMTRSAEIEKEENLENIVLVDSYTIPENLTKIKDKKPLIVIDHHRGSKLAEGENSFYWIEDAQGKNGVGSASTMVVEIMMAMDLFSDEKIPEEDRIVALMLILGIYTDTRKLVGSSKRDRIAYSYLTDKIDEEELGKLFYYSKPKSYYDNQTKAGSTYECKGSKLVANVGFISAQNSDDLAEIASSFIDMDGISLVIVWGVLVENGNKTICVKARSENDFNVSLDQFLRDRFRSQEGWTAGGKPVHGGRSEGGAESSLKDFPKWMLPESPEEITSFVDVINKRIKTIVFQD